MKRRQGALRATLPFAVALCALLGPAAGLADTFAGQIVGVTDGDTLTLLDDSKVRHHIRIAGIDAPESKQAYGKAAKQHLAELAFGREAVAECGKLDKYERLVCVVRVGGDPGGVEPGSSSESSTGGTGQQGGTGGNAGDAGGAGGVDVGLAQIEAGLAWWYRKYQREQRAEDRAAYEAAEAAARAAGRGLWVAAGDGGAAPVAPWEWRRERKAEAAAWRRAREGVKE
jgi:endonuclease YncB( thermonuclease family)